jgi:predicted DsbA family dithiol-disulfide isomerase
VAIEVFAELACPFTHLALRRIVERRREEGRSTPVLRIRPWPLEWVNGAPLDAAHVGAEVRALRAQVTPDLFEGFDAGVFPATSLPGFRLVEAAYSVDQGTGERLSLALRGALFEDGRDIAEAAVLAEIAAAHGVGVPDETAEREVRRAFTEGRERGVQGSPHFFVGGSSAFCPLLDIRRDNVGELHITLDPIAVDELLDQWFASEDADG